MSNSEIVIRAAGGYVEAVVGDAPPDLRDLARDRNGKPVRRVGRYIQLAMIGAARCLGASAPPPDTAVYIGARRADIDTTSEVMSQVLRDKEEPRPLSFVNTVTNAACYYIARQFGLHGRSSFLGGENFSFESALALAALDLELGVVRSALVGAIDVAAKPLSVHRARLGVAEGTVLGESSQWLWLTRGGEGLGVLHGADILPANADLSGWIERKGGRGPLALAKGQYLNAQQADAAESALVPAATFDYRTARPYHDCQASAAIPAFLSSTFVAPTLVHLNADDFGRHAIMLVARRDEGVV